LSKTGHFKGSKNYYESNTKMDLTELTRIFEDDTVKISATKGYTPKEILSDQDLARITDRSPEAYEDQSGDTDRFRIVEESEELAV
jgi:hypothetical protein